MYDGVQHEFVDQKKLGTHDGIYVTSAATAKVTVKNMTVTGYNYYGVIYVPEQASYAATCVEYISVTYTGPQLSFNPYGLTRIIDSVITIKENYAAGNEVAECNKIEVGGTTTIIHTSTANSAFWFRNSSPSFTVLRGSKVYFTSSSRELFYGVTNLNLVVSKDASIYIVSHNGLAYGTYGTGSTTVEENAVLTITKTGYSGSYATWYSYGAITVSNGATLSVINEYTNITTQNYNISFVGTDSGLVLNNPEKVVLYNTVASAIYAQSTAKFDFTYTRINLFENAVDMTQNISSTTLPTFAWYKEGEVSKVTGTFTSSKTNISYTNYTEEELNALPSLDNFNFNGKKIISLGTFMFVVGGVTTKDTMLQGVTLPYASLVISYEDKEGVAVANENGEFSYSYGVELKEGTEIILNCKTYNDVLYYTKKIQIVYSGELVISEATKHFNFEVYAMSLSPVICPRQGALKITVIDSRVNSSEWKLYAKLNSQMQSKEGDALENALVFVDSTHNIHVLSDTPVLVYTGSPNIEGVSITSVEWSEDEGVLLQLLSPIMNGRVYDAEITWIIEE